MIPQSPETYVCLINYVYLLNALTEFAKNLECLGPMHRYSPRTARNAPEKHQRKRSRPLCQHFQDLKSQEYGGVSNSSYEDIRIESILRPTAEALWNSACAHVFSFFLASRFEIRKWILRLQVQRVSGGHI